MKLAIPLAAAAAIAVIFWMAGSPSAVQVNPSPIADAPQLPSPDQLMAVFHDRLTDPATRALNQSRYAYLDRDARRLLTFVAEELPDFQPPAGTNPGP